MCAVAAYASAVQMYHNHYGPVPGRGSTHIDTAADRTAQTAQSATQVRWPC
jgi:hypothetical protein